MHTIVSEIVDERIFSVEEWLEAEKTAEARHEFVYGKLIAMPGEAKIANRIAINIVKKLDDVLAAKGFEMFTHDVKTEIVPQGLYRYPDLVVAPEVDDEDAYIVKHPVLLLEVASSESRHRDRIIKGLEYHNLFSLWYYIVILQDEMLAEAHARNEDGSWSVAYYTQPDHEILLPKFETALKMSDIYLRIKV